MPAVSDMLRDGYLVDLTNAQRALRELQIVAGYSDRDAARKLLVSYHTYRRWRHDRTPNPTAVRLLAIQAGYVPWVGWHGWEVHDGLLFPPGSRHGFAPAQVESLPFLLALTRDMRRKSAPARSETEQPAKTPWWRRVGGWR